MVTSCSLVCGASALVPSEMPDSIAHTLPASYQVEPEVVSTPSMRARTVHSMPRVMLAPGEKVVPLVPLNSSRLVTKSMESLDQWPLGISEKLRALLTNFTVSPSDRDTVTPLSDGMVSRRSTRLPSAFCSMATVP